MTTEEQVAAIEKEIRETPYHKGTEHHIGKLRARIARLKERLDKPTGKSGGGGGPGPGKGGYAVKKQGDATIVLVGPPSVGKSTLINTLTNAKSKIAPYAFTTVTVIPGMMKYKNANIQILDVPGLIEGAEEGKGRGREVLSVARGANLLILITDPERLEAVDRIKAALERNGIRVDKTPPEVIIDKKLKGGLIVRSNIKQDLDKETVKEVANEFGIKNAEITIKEKLTMETLIDVFARNRVYIKSLIVVNKIDEVKNTTFTPRSPGEVGSVSISAEHGTNLDLLKEKIWESLGFITVYLVRPGEKPHKESPIIAKRGVTFKEIAEAIGSDFTEGKKNAKIWGQGAKHAGQIVSLLKKAEDQVEVMFI